MLRDQRIAVVVPARDEARHIGQVLSSMPAFVDAIVVVDDGSRDGTAARAEQHDDGRLTLVRHDRAQGVGGALRSGYAAAFRVGADVVAVMAGDGQMDPADLPALLSPVLSGRAGYAKGNRLGHARLPDMPRHRLWGNRLLSWLTRLATGLSVGDSQCGYTALSLEAYERVPWQRLWSGYGYPNDLLGWLALRGITVCDVRVRPVYGSESSGVRLHHAVVTIPGLLLRVGLRRLRARPLLGDKQTRSAAGPASPRLTAEAPGQQPRVDTTR